MDTQSRGRTEQPSIARCIDISAVRAQHAESDVRKLAEYARSGNFINAHVLPNWVPLLRELLAGSDTLVGSPVGFPGGAHATPIKVAEAEWLLGAGVQEVDAVMNIGRLRSGDDAYVRRELEALREVIPQDIPLKVIFETSLLSADEIRRGSALAVESRFDFVKTGTGWTGVPIDLDTVRLIREVVGDALAIKAVGGLHDLDTVLAFQSELGVERFGIGVDGAVAILEEERRRRGADAEVGAR